MGLGWWHDWVTIAQWKKNIYGDLCIWQLTAESKPHLFRRYLREILDIIGPDQILFGSDGPILEPMVSNRRAIEIFRSLTKKGTDGIRFTEDEIEAILGGNAMRIYDFKE
jgi:predicted TIM-barrel fold metal-dependent hydrolase